MARFLTLTTSETQLANIDYDEKQLNDSFRKLKQRITRQSPYKLYKAGYITKSEMSYYYGHQKLFDNFDFNYFKVATNEGNGVLHIVFKGSYLPYNYIVDNWMDIHNSWDINIKIIKPTKKDTQKATSYCVTQYLANQGTSYQRSSMSWDWTIRAYVREWTEFKQMFENTHNYNQDIRCYYNFKSH